MRPWLIVALLARPAAAAAVDRLCPGVEFVGEEIDLSEAERKMVCGDPDSDGWQSVPLNQARYFLRAFLQARGYHRPRLEERRGRLRVDPGPRTRIESLTADGLPPDVRLSKRRRTRGRVLTPKELDRLKNWITAELQERGHGCPEVRMSADPSTGRLHAEVEPGPVHLVEEIVEPELQGIGNWVFHRFEAFRYGRPLDVRLLALTARRIIEQDLFLSAYHDLSCEGGRLTITRRVVPAEPRLVTIGVGADSEGYLRARARWKHSRIGRRASSAEAVIFSSFREQSGDAFMRWYPLPTSRFHFLPRVQARREAEIRYEALFSQVSLQPAWTWDSQAVRLELRSGPAFEYNKTLDGIGPPDEAFFSVTSRVDAMSHLYEYYLREPRTGWRATLDASSRVRGARSNITAHRALLRAQFLWNLGRYDPPLAVLGWRGLAGTVVTGAGTVPAALPPTLRFFLGGDDDIRGFSRKQLPAAELGFLTAVYQGLELRAGDLLPYNVQPLVFVDAAMGGREDLELDRDVYWSPGFGLRWGSPIGSVRATLARGYTWRRDPEVPAISPHWQFFFSFGQEF